MYAQAALYLIAFSKQLNIIHRVMFAIRRPQRATVGARRSRQQVVFKRYALKSFAVPAGIKSRHALGVCICGDARAQIKQRLNVFVLPQISACVYLGNDMWWSSNFGQFYKFFWC